MLVFSRDIGSGVMSALVLVRVRVRVSAVFGVRDACVAVRLVLFPHYIAQRTT